MGWAGFRRWPSRRRRRSSRGLGDGAGDRGGADKDPSEIVIDEVVGMWIALWPLSAGLWHAGADPWVFPWPGWVGAFVMFRLFDVWKPGPVGWADRRPGSMGVMLDDVIAGLMAAAVVTLGAGVAHGLMGV
jgi:phosphatidylglycerophosphatase A